MGLLVSYCFNCHKPIEHFITHPKNCKHCQHPVDIESLRKTLFKPWESYSMKTNFELVKEFHKAFNKVPDPEVPTNQPTEIRQLRAKLINEEYNEVLQELGHSATDFSGDCAGYISDDYTPVFGLQRPFNTFDINKLAKELADLLYVVYGTAAAYGIPIDDVYREVHRSNMSKLGEDGKPIYREDGKVLKGPNYSVANVEEVLRRVTDGKSTS